MTKEHEKPLIGKEEHGCFYNTFWDGWKKWVFLLVIVGAIVGILIPVMNKGEVEETDAALEDGSGDIADDAAETNAVEDDVVDDEVVDDEVVEDEVVDDEVVEEEVVEDEVVDE